MHFVSLSYFWIFLESSVYKFETWLSPWRHFLNSPPEALLCAVGSDSFGAPIRLGLEGTSWTAGAG